MPTREVAPAWTGMPPEPETPSPPSAPRPASGRARRRARPLPAGWPLIALLAGFPVFWMLGLSNFAATIVAFPMASQLLKRRPIKVPRGFVFWLLFLLWTFAALAMLGVNPPGTVPDSAAQRLLGFGLRDLSYLSITVVFLYIGNLTEEEFPRERLVRLLGWLFIWTVAGGVLGMLLPYFSFTSPFELMLPDSIRFHIFVQHLVHPSAAQVQDIGGAKPRPAAPFSYTNVWGYHVTVLAVWFVAGWVLHRRPGTRLLALGVLAVGTVTLIYSLNRAAWAGCAVAVVYVVFRLAMHRRLLPAALMLFAISAGTLVVFATPLQDVITGRLQNGKSDGIRAFTTRRALELSAQSPVLGYGSTRAAQGSATSIAVGKSPDCPQCGNFAIGINGYFFMLLMTTGWVGALLFGAFGLSQVRQARGDPSPIAAAGITVIVMTAFYGVAYDISTWLLVPMITLAVLWREAQSRESRRLREEERLRWTERREVEEREAQRLEAQSSMLERTR